MACLDVLSSRFKAMVQSGLQTGLMAVAASINTGLHGVFRHFGAFDRGWVVHGILFLCLRKLARPKRGSHPDS